MAKSMDSRKNRIKEINTNLEKREQQVSELENKYEQAMDARTALEGVEGLDEEVKQHFQELSAAELQELHEEGEQLSEDMMEETQQLDEVRQENAEAKEANQEAMQHAQTFDSITGADTSSALEEGAEAITEIDDDLAESQQKLDELSNRARNLSKRGGSF